MSEQTNWICSEWVADEGKESLERLDGAFLADPEQARHSGVDLVDQSQVLVAFGVLDFIHADGADRFQRAVLQTPANHVFDRVAHLVPGSVERLGGFLPGELARPAGQKQHVGLGGLVLAIAPRNLLHHNAAVPAMDAPHPVQKENQKAPERDELKTPLGQMIVTRWRPRSPRNISGGGRSKAISRRSGPHAPRLAKPIPSGFGFEGWRKSPG